MLVKLGAVSVLCLASASALGAEQEREVPAFDSIHVASGIRASVTVGPRKPLRLKADEQVLSLVETRVEDRTLHIGFKPHTRLHDSGEVVVTAQTPELHAVAASGGAIVRAAFTKAEESALDASGGGEIRVSGVDARRLIAKASGGSDLHVSGRADNVELRLSGGSHFDGPQLEARDVEVSGSGGAVAELRASGNVRGGLSGGSEMHVRGGARTSVATSGGSEVSVEER
jgi:putative autotransporter adhesin-like protein